jgi:hypothetical protein
LIVLRLIRTNRLKRAPHAPYAKKERFAAKDLQDLRAAFHMAQEMGARVGRGALLFGSLPDG